MHAGTSRTTLPAGAPRPVGYLRDLSWPFAFCIEPRPGRPQSGAVSRRPTPMSSHDRLPPSDILRPTELHDFGDVFRSARRPDRRLVAVLALAGLLALGQLITGGPVEGAGDPLAAATNLDHTGFR